MKKLTGILAIIFTGALFLQSCEKFGRENQTKVEKITVNVELKKNEIYNYAIPENLSDNEYKITQQASHYKVSELVTQKHYTYQPTKDYVGSDQVVIANVEKEKQSGQGNNGNGGSSCGGNGGCCSENDVTERIITINFIIKDTPVGIVNNSSEGKGN